MDQITIELNKNFSTTIYRSKKTKLCVALTNNGSPIIKGQIIFGKILISIDQIFKLAHFLWNAVRSSNPLLFFETF